MHLIVPFAVPLAPEGQALLPALRLPRLAALRECLPEADRETASEWSLSAPHERALARAAGWAAPDGLLPLAAEAAARLGIDTGDLAWAQLTPVHWHLGTEQVSLVDPAGLALDEADSRGLFHAVQPLFVDDGWLLAWGDRARWFAAHECLASLPTASLDRVIGRNVDAWLGSDPAARRLRRLQAELQMLLHTHPINADREARGLLPVNSVWVSGTGVRQAPAAPRPAPTVEASLRAPALAGNWPAWQKAWQALDEGPLAALLERARRGEAAMLTLAGERGSVTLAGPPRSKPARWLASLRAPRLDAWLEGL